jgi:hypothetical protein
MTSTTSVARRSCSWRSSSGAADINGRIDAAAVRATDLGSRQALEANARVYLDATWANRHTAMVLTR